MRYDCIAPSETFHKGNGWLSIDSDDHRHLSGLTSTSRDEVSGPKTRAKNIMKKKPTLPRKSSDEQAIDFDLEIIKASIESGVVSFPAGLKAKERKEWIRNHLKPLDQHLTS